MVSLFRFIEQARPHVQTSASNPDGMPTSCKQLALNAGGCFAIGNTFCRGRRAEVEVGSLLPWNNIKSKIGIPGSFGLKNSVFSSC